MNSLSCIVATCGSDEWKRLGDQAAATANGPVVRVHDPKGSVASARNAGLNEVETEFVCWLDADDSLTPNFFTEMVNGKADIRQPSVSGWGGGVHPPQCHHHGPAHTATRECLAYGNPFSLGAVIRTELARQHPWDERWPVLEDFAFYRRICANPNVTVECVPTAVYRTRTRANPHPRNRSLPRPQWEAIGRQIAESIPFPEVS